MIDPGTSRNIWEHLGTSGNICYNTVLESSGSIVHPYSHGYILESHSLELVFLQRFTGEHEVTQVVMAMFVCSSFSPAFIKLVDLIL